LAHCASKAINNELSHQRIVQVRMAGDVPFLMKDVVLLAISIYLLKQDVARMSLCVETADMTPNRLRTNGMAAASRSVAERLA
jgi:hypothetical protein